MKTIEVTVKNEKDLEFLKKVLNQLECVDSVDSNKKKSLSKNQKLKKAISFSEKKDGLKDLIGIWKHSDVTLDEIRKKAWERN